MKRKQLFPIIILMLICSGIVIADQKVISSEDDFKIGSFSSMQLNLNPSNACDASRYTSAGYDYPDTSINPSGTCNQCDGSGNMQHIPSGQDPFSECGTTNCLTGTCNGIGACGYYTSEQHNCASGYVCFNNGECILPWISGFCGIDVYYIDSSTEQWKTSNTVCEGPQCSITTDCFETYCNNLVISNSIDFSEYPARNVCKALGGRLPTITELYCIYTNKINYGTFMDNTYWSSLELRQDTAFLRKLTDGNGNVYNTYKSNNKYVRCVR